MDNKYTQQFKKGSLEMVLLSLIYAKETYGYELISNLNETGGKIFGYTREGTIYPLLYRLRDNGLIQSRMTPSPANGGMKKYYSITEKGTETLLEMVQYWDEYVSCVNSFVELVERSEKY